MTNQINSVFINKQECKGMDNNKTVEELIAYKDLLECYEEACDDLQDLVEYRDSIVLENKYLKDFIHYKNLDEEFAYFQEHAVEDTNSDLPFPYFVIE